MSTKKAADAAAQTETTAAPDGAGNVPTVAPAPAPAPALVEAAPTPAHDEHHGRGGLYQRNADGTRTLIERTQPEAEGASNHG